MTPEELIKWCDAAGASDPGCSCATRMFHDKECTHEAWVRDRNFALRRLSLAGFSSPARARSYAALWAALEMEGCHAEAGQIACDFLDEPFCLRCKALATTEEKE